MKKRILCIIMIIQILLCFFSLPANAEENTSDETVTLEGSYTGKCGDNITYTFNDTLLSFTGSGKMYNKDNSWFYEHAKQNVTTIIIEEGITSIGNDLFCNFYSLNSIYIPQTVTSIGDRCFENCRNLKSIRLPNSMTYIGEYAFLRCTGLSSINIPEGIKSISDGAFYYCSSLQQVVIPKSVTQIGEDAFAGASVKEIYYSGTADDWNKVNVMYEEDETLAAASIQFFPYAGKCGDNLLWTLDTNGTLSIFGSGDMWDFQKEYAVSNAPWFSINDEVKVIDLQNGVTSVGEYAFYQCHDFTRVSFPTSLTLIGDNSFSYTSVFPQISIIIPKNVTYIGESAFECSNLKSVSLPVGLKTIEKWAFSYNHNLTDVYYAGSEDDWEKVNVGYDDNYLNKATFHYNLEAEGKCGDNVSWTLHNGILTISGSGEMWDYISYNVYPDWYYFTDSYSVIIENNVTGIGEYAFWNCKNLTTISIPASVSTISSGAFSDCSDLLSISVDNSNTDFTSLDGVLYSKDMSSIICCPAGKTGNYSVPVGVEIIDESAFEGCTGLNSVTIPNTVTEIGYAAFSGCSALTNIIIPDNVTFIDMYAFQYCSGLTSISFPSGITSLSAVLFEGCTELESVFLPSGLTKIENAVFYNCNQLNDVFFAGSSEVWSKISINPYNEPLQNAAVYCLFGCDVDQNGNYSLKDVSLLFSCWTGKLTESGLSISDIQCDVNHDGISDLRDIALFFNRLSDINACMKTNT